MSAGGSYSKSKGRSKSNLTPEQYVDLYKQSLPSILSTISGQVAPTAESQAAAQTGILDKYGSHYQDVGQRMAASEAANTNRLLQGPGGDAARSAVALNTSLNPAQAAANKGATDLISSYNLQGLSPGEQNAVERVTNQGNTASGNLGVMNPMNTVANALNFGNAYRQKQQAFEGALNTATNVANAQNTQVNPLAVASGAGNVAGNFGLSQLNPGTTTQIPFQTATGWGGQLGGIASATNSKNNSMGISAQGGCCFIMMEAYHGKMPTHVRRCRDAYYKAFPDIAIGYKRMAKWLVPLMQRYDTVRTLVWYSMVLPLSEYGKFVTRKDITKRNYRIARIFWFTVWNAIGKI